MRQLMKCLITLWLTLSVSMGSYGLTGNEMLRKCDLDNPTFMSGVCSGYIYGANEMQLLFSLMDAPPFYCQPAGVDNGQRDRIVIKYMKENPEVLHMPFLNIIVKALMEAFPCD